MLAVRFSELDSASQAGAWSRSAAALVSRSADYALFFGQGVQIEVVVIVIKDHFGIVFINYRLNVCSAHATELLLGTLVNARYSRGIRTHLQTAHYHVYRLV